MRTSSLADSIREIIAEFANNASSWRKTNEAVLRATHWGYTSQLASETVAWLTDCATKG